MRTYERLSERIARGRAAGENVEHFERALAGLPKPAHIVEREQQQQRARELADRVAFRQLVIEARCKGDIAGLMVLFEMTVDELTQLMRDERATQRAH